MRVLAVCLKILTLLFHTVTSVVSATLQVSGTRTTPTYLNRQSRRRRRRRRKKTGAGDSLFARLNAYSNEDFTVISLRLPVP